MTTIFDVLFYVMIALIPSMLVLGFLLRRNPFDQKPILFHEGDELKTVDNPQWRDAIK